MIRHRSLPYRPALLSLAVATSLMLGACSDDDDGTSDTPEIDGSDTTETTDSTDTDANNDTDDTNDMDDTEVTVGAATSTAGVECDYMDVTFNDAEEIQMESRATWSCTDTTRELDANGIPDHDVGPFDGGDRERTITEQGVTVAYAINPRTTDRATQLGGPGGPTGFVLNGVKMDPGTAGTCDDTGENCSLGADVGGRWSIEALGQDTFAFGTDGSNAHVQPTGAYHYHGMPEGFIEKRSGGPDRMTLIGWASDGFPIYARYGYSDPTNAASAIVVMEGSYELVQTVSDSRPPLETVPLGVFSQDWEYVEGSGDLDECNGRVGVTPEFPSGIYHYFATDDYPYLHRCVTGEVAEREGRPRQP